ncbi:threonine--tRNA ligase [Candidatus Woesebacteria bacterium]|nr:threonine--tRNA ligase [Candidatus Woesebacteria bacterium]
MPAIQNKKLETMRHSTEHVLTQAMLKLYPGLKMAMGPATEDGFYFDFDFKGKISEDDFPKIEEEMKKIIKKDLPFKKENLTIEEARKLFKNNKYKQEWLDEIENKGEKATVYWTGDEFVDLCSGLHIASTGKIGPFKLLSVAGAYWRGDEKNKMLTRIYGTTFPTRKELDGHLKKLEEAKKRDHRVLGQKLELFMFDDEVGQGLPLWLPKGAFVRHKIMEFAFNTYLERGYQPVVGPHISTEALWKHSGHLDFYKELMYSSFGIDDEQYRLKPMNCPIHVKMYNLRPRSYRELPLRWTEMGTVYRYEKSGVLHGLTRVRGFTQDDAHIICRPDQLHDELVGALKLTLYILGSFGFEDFEMSLSVRDKKNKDKYAGDDEGWEMAEKALVKALSAINYKKYTLDVGGAVFYGPKIDLKVADSIGRKWQLSTIQFDFNLPGSFKMKYIGKDGKEHEPFMIHRALLGSLERFMGIYIEHTAGEFPVWLAPVQAKILPVTERNIKYAKSVAEKLKQKSIRVEVDERNETLPAKVRDAQIEKVPYMLIVGDKEEKDKTVSERGRSGKDYGQQKLEKFIKNIEEEIENKAID